jgi:hypothetical protein
LFNIPFGAIQFFMIIGSAWAATHWQRKGLTIAAVSVLPIVGTVLMLTVPRSDHNKGVLLFGYYLVSHSHFWVANPGTLLDLSSHCSIRCLAWPPSRP